MNRDQILDTAGSLINGDRARDYGDAAENFQRIADLWCPILGVDVTATDVALCLTQLKVARLITSPGHQDSWVDAAGYVALGGEIASRSAAVDVAQEPLADWERELLEAIDDPAPLAAGATWGYDPAGPRKAATPTSLDPDTLDVTEAVYADPQGETVVRGTE